MKCDGYEFDVENLMKSILNGEDRQFRAKLCETCETVTANEITFFLYFIPNLSDAKLLQKNKK